MIIPNAIRGNAGRIRLMILQIKFVNLWAAWKMVPILGGEVKIQKAALGLLIVSLEMKFFLTAA
jgi:hypothetical protein